MAHSINTSADLLKLKEEIKEAEIKIQQLSAERETLVERLKVSPSVVLFMVYMICVQHYGLLQK